MSNILTATMQIRDCSCIWSSARDRARTVLWIAYLLSVVRL